MPLKKVRVGVVGVGGMGSGHCATMSTIEEAQLTAVCDINPETANEVGAKYGVPHFADSTALLESGLVNAVVIATPHYDHPPIAIEAFKNGIHVLSEKPIAVTVSAADEMTSTAKASALKF